MRIIVVHNAYQRAGGEDAVVRAELELLGSAGHDVLPLIVSNHSISGLGSKMRTMLLTPANPFSGRWIARNIREFGADLVHVHNFFPLLSPQVHESAAATGTAVVQTLHNFRLHCAGALYMRDGATCEDCLGRVGLAAVRHRCYRGSAVGSAAVVAMQQLARARNTWFRSVDAFIALTQFAAAKLAQGGLPAERIVVKPNFADLPAPQPARRSGLLYVGRLSREKGADVLVEAARALPEQQVTVLGTGPEEEALRSAAPPNVHFAGLVGPEEVARQMAQASLLIIPSRCYEGFPLTLVEAAAAGLPAVVSRIGSLAEIVVEGVNGFHFRTGDDTDLARVVRSLLQDHDRLGAMQRDARLLYEQRYTSRANLPQLEAIYALALRRAADRVVSGRSTLSAQSPPAPVERLPS